ncbi:MAG: TonB-dependent siderophore receptor, partial [Pseudomonas sp.]
MVLATGLAAAPALANQDEALQLESVEVRAEQAGSGYVTSNVSSATKSDLPLRETPQSVQVVNSQMLSDIGALRLDDTLDYVSGLARQNSFGGLWDNFSVRGFSGNENTGAQILRNGFVANRGFNARRDMANVERVEFLKGPASALYGSSDPGGTLNVVTKKPQWTRSGSAKLSYGSYDARRAELDLTGPATERLAYRLNLAVEDNGSFRDKIDSERQFVAPALTFRASNSTTFMYDGEFLRHKAPLDRGVVAVDNKLGVVPLSRFLGEPGDGPITVENHTHQLSMEHYFRADWHTRLAAGYKEGTLEGFSTEPSRLVDGRTLQRQRRYRDSESTDISFQAELFGRVETGQVLHNLILGADTYRFENDQVMLRVNPSADAPYPIDIFDPVYGQPLPQPLANTDR